MKTMKPLVTDFDRKHNPYLTRFIEAGGTEGWLGDPNFLSKLQSALESHSTMNAFMARCNVRDVCIHEYGFAIPDHPALQLIKTHSPRGVVEIGAGTGYWASLLEKIGVEVAAYDVGVGVKRHGFCKTWTKVIRGNHNKAFMTRQNHDRTLFLCWPSYSEEWPTAALKLFGGQKVAVIGEGPGGCTASDSFFAHLDDHWTEIDTYSIPQWFGIHDYLAIYERKEK